MNQEQGFLIKKKNGKITVNYKKTTSILTNQLLADYLKDISVYLRGKLLDLGCGEKPYKLIYEDVCESSIGVDVETCRHEQKYVDVFASADCLPFENETFDTVLCTNVLEHVANAEKAFQEISRVLKKDGYLVLAVPFLYPVHEAPYDFYRYTKYGIEYQMKKNGFKIERNMPWGGIGMFLCVYFHLFLGKMVKIGWVQIFSCLLQKGTYFVIRKFCYRRLYNGKGKNGSIITLGNFIVACKNG